MSSDRATGRRGTAILTAAGVVAVLSLAGATLVAAGDGNTRAARPIERRRLRRRRLPHGDPTDSGSARGGGTRQADNRSEERTRRSR